MHSDPDGGADSRPDSRKTRRVCAQLGLLAGLAVAVCVGFSFGPKPARAGGQWECPQEGECTFKKPNVLFVLEYSTAMNQAWDAEQTRWEVAVETITGMTAPGSFLSQNTHIALLRFGHDPDPNGAGTTIPGDVSGLVDGVALDLEWDDEQHDFSICAGQTMADTLAAIPAPLAGMPVGIGAWTKGALERAAVEIAQTQADHPEDAGDRHAMLFVVSSGIWTSADGQTQLGPPGDDPTLAAAQLLDAKVRTHTLALTDDPTALAVADALAAAGGTVEALVDPDPEAAYIPLANALQEIIDDVGWDLCLEGLPRVMILLDASSSMLNVDGGASFGAMGETPWDQLREAFRGYDNLNFFRTPHEWAFAAELADIGLAVFGDSLPAPGEQRLLAQYDRCLEGAFEWALDPQTACEQPGCSDPWAGPPIDWTFEDSSIDLPAYPLTYNHMPRCEGDVACKGSGSYVHLGLELIAQNQAEYHLAGFGPNASYTTTEATKYMNILITDGGYLGYSTDAQVQAALEGMFAAGITTHVIGFGELAQTPQALGDLAKMADWGSGGALDHHAAPSVAELEIAFTQIVATLEVGPCCWFNECYGSCPPWADCEPTTGEDDPIDSADGDGDGDSEDGDPSDSGPGDGDGEPGHGDDDDTDTGDSGDGDPTGSSGDTDGGDLPADAGDIYEIEDSGCNCEAQPHPRAWPALLLLLGPLRRRRQGARVIQPSPLAATSRARSSSSTGHSSSINRYSP